MKDRDVYILLEQLGEMKNSLEKCLEILKEYLPYDKKDKECLNCGKPYKGRSPNQKFCCEYCKNEYRKRSKNVN